MAWLLWWTIVGQTLPVLPLWVHPGDTLWVEIAATPEAQVQGLMFRDTLPENRGMLFVYPEPRRLVFWMRNTTIPLDLAFADEQGVIVEIQQMEPLSDSLHQAPQPVRYALEVNRGWFQRHGVQVGDTLKGPAILLP